MNVTIEPAVDDSFPSKQVLRAARALADSHGLRARATIAALIDRECSGILGAGDRRELLDDFLAERATRVIRVLTGLGLVCLSAESTAFEPGTWSLASERDGQGHVFFVCGIRTRSGTVTSVRMTAHVLLSPCLAWRAIAKAAGIGKYPKPTAAEWRQIWNGCERKSIAGIRGTMTRKMVSLEKGQS